MALNRTEKNVALSLFIKGEHGALGRLIEETANLTKDQKIDLLSSLLQVSVSGAGRVAYDVATKQLIDDVLAVINAEDRDSKLTVVGQESEAQTG